jgi:hypothetical protein
MKPRRRRPNQPSNVQAYRVACVVPTLFHQERNTARVFGALQKQAIFTHSILSEDFMSRAVWAFARIQRQPSSGGKRQPMEVILWHVPNWQCASIGAMVLPSRIMTLDVGLNAVEIMHWLYMA